MAVPHSWNETEPVVVGAAQGRTPGVSGVRRLQPIPTPPLPSVEIPTHV